MTTDVFAKNILKHLVNGTFETTLCRICLRPFGEVCENIFTQFWVKNSIFSIAEILKIICQAEFSEMDNYNVCSDCIVEALNAYKFYLKFKESTINLKYYINEINECMASVDDICLDNDTQVCLQIEPSKTVETDLQEYEVLSFLVRSFEMCPEELDIEIKKRHCIKSWNSKKNSLVNLEDTKNQESNNESDNNVDMNNEDFLAEGNEKPTKKTIVKKRRPRNKRLRKRLKKKCDLCLITFRQHSTFLRHCKKLHNLNYCEICSDSYKDAELELHIQSHGNVYCCDICKTIVEHQSDLIEHLSSHEKQFVCDICGFTSKSVYSRKNHLKLHMGNNYTCSFCGKEYLGPANLSRHLVKHAVLSKNKNLSTKELTMEVDRVKNRKSTRQLCSECGGEFVNRRVLLRHILRMHTPHLPVVCEYKECGKKFASKNDLTEHINNKHRLPKLRCPLCPAVFPTTSRVSCHMKQVHLQKKKRQSREYRQEVTWVTTKVPFEKLRLDVQHIIVEKVKAGEMTLPEEMLTDNLKAMLNIEKKPANEIQMRVFAGRIK